MFVHQSSYAKRLQILIFTLTRCSDLVLQYSDVRIHLYSWPSAFSSHSIKIREVSPWLSKRIKWEQRVNVVKEKQSRPWWGNRGSGTQSLNVLHHCVTHNVGHLTRPYLCETRRRIKVGRMSREHASINMEHAWKRVYRYVGGAATPTGRTGMSAGRLGY